MNADLLATLNAERYTTGDWFTRKEEPRHPEPPLGVVCDYDDSEITTARRRRDALADLTHHDHARTA